VLINHRKEVLSVDKVLKIQILLTTESCFNQNIQDFAQIRDIQVGMM
jgi:hypothetical protein